MKKKIVILTHDDSIWSVIAWDATIFLLKKRGYDISAVFECEETLVNLRGYRVILWYLKIFGFFTFSILCIFFILFRILESMI